MHFGNPDSKIIESWKNASLKTMVSKLGCKEIKYYEFEVGKKDGPPKIEF